MNQIDKKFIIRFNNYKSIMTKSPIIIECPLSSHDIFIINCTETMHELEKYKLKANLMDCNISKEEVTKYYEHFIKKSSNRLDFLYQRL